MSKKDHLIIFVRNPVMGKVKTRLSKSLGDARALEIYYKLLDHTRDTALQVDCSRSVFCDETPALGSSWSSEDFFITKQHGTNLGERMGNAFKEVFAEGASAMIIIGSDCPGITPDMIQEAFEKLKQFDLVIGPARDGGYYLLGMNRPILQLFTDIKWSTSTVFDETVLTASDMGLSYFQLPMLSDIDESVDLEFYPGFF